MERAGASQADWGTATAVRRRMATAASTRRARRRCFRRLTDRPPICSASRTAGSVDDGKSTLIGRLLYDSKQVLVDQLEHVEQTSKRMGHDFVDLSLLTDGLRAEREQGITSTSPTATSRPRSGASISPTRPGTSSTPATCHGRLHGDLAIVLVDARKGVVAQSQAARVHQLAARDPHVVVCVNKMDLVDFQESSSTRSSRTSTLRGAPGDAGRDLHPDLGAARRQRRRALGEHALVPGGRALHLEHVHIASDRNLIDVRFPVQWSSAASADASDYRAMPAVAGA